MPSLKPNIAVLLATHNGMRWLPLQLESILGQREVNVIVWVSDDASSDGTYEWLQEQSRRDVRIRLLPRTGPYGSAAQNFFRLVREAGWQEADYVSFADQDDIWSLEKLHLHAALIAERNLTAVSSNVTAFWADDRKVLIDKSHPQTEWDYVFESAGPGCTYLMKPGLLEQLKNLLQDDESVARQCALHDWLVYALCRSTGGTWFVNPQPSMLYRQHGANEFGANVGLRQLIQRLKKTYSGWHRQEALKIVTCVLPLMECGTKQDDLLLLRQALENGGVRSRLCLLGFTLRGRRKLAERIALNLLVVLGIW